MKKILLLSIFLSFVSQAAPLAGDYFINQSGSEDYSSIAAAVADLEVNGISAPVSFRIRTGTYDEQITMNSIDRTMANTTDRVVFKRASPTANVIWKNSTQVLANNWIVKLESVEFISFVGIRFEATNSDAQTILYIVNNSDSVTVANCTFQGLVPSSNFDLRNELLLFSSISSASGISEGFIIDGNTFSLGFQGIKGFLGGFSIPSIIIKNNTFSGQANRGINVKIDDIDSVIENNNFIDALSTFTSMDYIALDFEGIAIIRNNKINISQKGVFGMVLNNDSSGNMLVYNNFISITNPNGNSIAAQLGDRIKFMHNSIRTEQATDIGILVSATTQLSIINNIIMNTGGGITLSVPLDSNIDGISQLVDNNIYTSGSTLVSWGESSPGVSDNYATFDGFQTHVQAIHPNVGLSRFILFLGTTSGDINDLHLPLLLIADADLVAHPQDEVVDDIDGDIRTSINVYVGADQSPLVVVPLDNIDSNNGSFYTVGGSSPDFLTPQEAFDNLYHRGTKGEVKFKIRAGTYATKAYISNIVKQNYFDIITIAAANPGNHPLLTSKGPGSENNVIKLINSYFFVIKNIDFEMIGINNGGITIEQSKGNTIEGCLFTDGGTGITVESDSYGFYKNTITNNTFNSQRNSAISIDNMHGQTISGNTIDSSHLNYRAIEIFNVLSTQFYPTVIELNKISTCSGGGTNCFGIYINNSSGEENYRALIKNNFIHSVTDILLENSSSYWNIYHNTLVAHLFGIKTLASTGNDTTNLDIINNIIDTFNDVVLSINFGSLQSSDNININYNLYANGLATNLIEWFSQEFTDLQSYKNFTDSDYYSLDKFADFVDKVNEDYHLANTANGDNDYAGIHVISTSTDIDGDIRNNTFPYIGADEASIALSAARVSVGGGNTTSENSNGVILGVRLLAQPTDDVDVAFASTNLNEGTVNAPAQLTFTAVNWNQSQTVTIQGVDDFISDGDVNYSVLYSVLSNDANYDAIPIQVLDFINTDNDLNSKIALEVINHASEPATAATLRFKLLKDMAPPNDVPLSDLQDIIIDYTYNGNTATVNSDYMALSGSVVLSALNNSVDISINPIDDNFIEAAEDLTITITTISGGLATVSIDAMTNGLSIQINDDENGEVSVSNSQDLAEPSTNGGFELTLTGGVSETDTETNYFLAGPPTPGVDYMAPTPTGIGVATIPALASSVIIPINVLDDIDSEGLEILTINLTTTNNALIATSTVNPPFARIDDDDTSGDISISITPNNPTFNTSTVTNLVFTLTNNSPINIHQAVLQSTEPVGLSYVNWQCLAAVQYCSQTAGMGDISEMVSIDANSQIQFSVDILATATPTVSLSVQATLNPAPFLTDTDPSNNTAIATSLLEIIFQNGFETSLNKQLYQAVIAFDQQDSLKSHYYFIDDGSTIYHFIQIDKENNTVRYRHVYVDTINQEINQSAWISHDK